jgi:stage V sporulation protein AC
MYIENNKEYKNLIKKHAPKSPVLKNSFFAFLIGGLLCAIGEWLAYFYRFLGVNTENSYVLVTVTYIVLASFATALGFFDKIAKVAGAGTLLPVTGFSNSVTSSAIDTKSEGFIGGVGKGIFTVAGPVILYSVIAGTVYGIIYYVYSTVILL